MAAGGTGGEPARIHPQHRGDRAPRPRGRRKTRACARKSAFLAGLQRDDLPLRVISALSGGGDQLVAEEARRWASNWWCRCPCRRRPTRILRGRPRPYKIPRVAGAGAVRLPLARASAWMTSGARRGAQSPVCAARDVRVLALPGPAGLVGQPPQRCHQRHRAGRGLPPAQYHARLPRGGHRAQPAGRRRKRPHLPRVPPRRMPRTPVPRRRHPPAAAAYGSRWRATAAAMGHRPCSTGTCSRSCRPSIAMQRATGEAIAGERASLLGRDMPAPPPDFVRATDALFGTADWLAAHFRRRMRGGMLATHALAAAMGLAFIILYSDLDAHRGFVALFLLLFALGRWCSWIAARRGMAPQVPRLPRPRRTCGCRCTGGWPASKPPTAAWATTSFLQKRDVDLSWIRHAMHAATCCATTASNPTPAGCTGSSRTGSAPAATPRQTSSQLRFPAGVARREHTYRTTTRLSGASPWPAACSARWPCWCSARAWAMAGAPGW